MGYEVRIDKTHRKANKLDAEKRKRDVREAITSADATGLIAGEELITEAETPALPQRPR